MWYEENAADQLAQRRLARLPRFPCVHAFQKTSKSGIATPKYEIDVVKERLKRLKEQLR